MINVKCLCKNCGDNHDIKVDDNALCESCFIAEAKSFKNFKEIIIIEKYSFMKDFKKFSFYSLLNLPIMAYFYLEFGLMTEFSYCLGIILGIISYPLACWLNDKF